MIWIDINNQRFIVGNTVVALPSIGDGRSPFAGVIEPGETMIIKMIYKDGNGIHLGLYSSNYKPGWHNLNGEVEDGHGWFMTVDETGSFFSARCGVQIVQDFEFKKRNLKGLKGRTLAKIDNSECILIELKENVGGSSGDAMGRKGHCIIINRKLTTEI